MRKFTVASALLAAGLVSGAGLRADGAILLSEILANEVSSDTTGEWIELMTSDGQAASLTGFKVGDEETSGGTSATEALFAFPAGASIAANDVIVVAVSATRFNTVYGFLPDFEFNSTDASVPDMVAYAAWDPDGGTVNMSNSNDQVVLLDGSDAIVDAASWVDSTFAFNPSLPTSLDGQSYRRINLTDTNTAADWEMSPDTGAAATRSSPGTLTAVPEPAGAAAILLAGLILGRRRLLRI